MKHRRVTREEAEEVYGAALAGLLMPLDDLPPATVDAVRFPAEPRPGTAAGEWSLPLTYRCSIDGRTHSLICREGPGVEELRTFLRGALPDIGEDDHVQLWFEGGQTGTALPREAL